MCLTSAELVEPSVFYFAELPTIFGTDFSLLLILLGFAQIRLFNFLPCWANCPIVNEKKDCRMVLQVVMWSMSGSESITCNMKHVFALALCIHMHTYTRGTWILMDSLRCICLHTGYDKLPLYIHALGYSHPLYDDLDQDLYPITIVTCSSYPVLSLHANMSNTCVVIIPLPWNHAILMQVWTNNFQ